MKIAQDVLLTGTLGLKLELSSMYGISFSAFTSRVLNLDFVWFDQQPVSQAFKPLLTNDTLTTLKAFPSL